MNDNFCLSLLRQQECEDHTVLVLAASGILAMPEEDATVLGVPLSESELTVLQQAEIFFQKDVTVDPVRWQARCHGKTWVCAVNDTRLAHGEVLSVKSGDHIDIGLLRFKVITADETSFPGAARGMPVEAESLDLGELASKPNWRAASDEDNPFDIVGARVPRLDEARDAAAPEEDILGRLADEYAQVVLNPEHLHRQREEENAPEPEHPLLSLEEALPRDQEWEEDQSLEDFVSGKLTIQDVLDRLGIDDFQQLEESESSGDEILMLFAQGVIPGQKPSERIPARTRRDHHRISLDSHYQPEERGGGSGGSRTGY
ncbi:MAG: TagK domain-containing protein [Candidatus Accumulibacter sp.]|jgi:hypothetical protein|nr:TagK domain-containing protein [Accumulibacter sp.]